MKRPEQMRRGGEGGHTATGKVIGKLPAQHRAVDFRDFPGDIDRQADDW